jgi:NAD-dependent dihydropyrimidine dehydrogenase PreA subunit
MSMSATPSHDAPDCGQPAGVFEPVIDRNRCEGAGDCVRVCPYGVFDLGKLLPAQRSGLSIRGRVKGFVHRWNQSFAVHADACHACGLCVKACPEDAITLRRV